MLVVRSQETEVRYYYHFDGLGSVVALSDNSGNVVERYSYDVFGEPNRTSDVNNPYYFTGRRYDSETGLYYYRARYYNPYIGRFLQTDPIPALNLYTYCGNNPVVNSDPTGERRSRYLGTFGTLIWLAPDMSTCTFICIDYYRVTVPAPECGTDKTKTKTKIIRRWSIQTFPLSMVDKFHMGVCPLVIYINRFPTPPGTI